MVDNNYLLNIINIISVLHSPSMLNSHQKVGIVIKLKSK
jgi:hypothetical protein